MRPKSTKMDRRISRTRRQLRNSLMSLILERGYNEVTIEDITERADLGRTTFYLHFHDKEALLVDTLEEIAIGLKAQVEQIARQEPDEGRPRANPVAIVFRHVNENRDLYRVILKGEGSSKASNRIREIIAESAGELLHSRLDENSSAPLLVPKEVMAGYFAAAMMGFISLWLEKDFPYKGDEAADLFMKLFFQGAGKLLNLNVEEIYS